MQTSLQNSLKSFAGRPTSCFFNQFRLGRLTASTQLGMVGFVFLLMSTLSGQAQGRLAGWNFDGTFAPTAASVVTGITASSVTTGSGITPGAGVTYFILNNFIATSWTNASSINTDDYIQFSVTPNSSYQMNLTSINIVVSNGVGLGPRNLALRSNLDNFATDLVTQSIGSINPLSPTSVTLTLSSAISSTAAVTFRLYGFNSGNNTAALQVLRADNLRVNGSLLYVNPTTLSGLDATCSTASTAQSFTVNATNAIGAVTLSAPTGFEVSTQSGGTCPTTGYASTTTVSPTSGTISQVICVRRQSGLTPGSVSSASQLSITGGVPLTATVALSGSTASLPDASFSGLPPSYCLGGGPIALSPTIGGGVFTVTGLGSITGNSYVPPASGSDGTATVTYSVTANGCSNTSSQTVNIGSQLTTATNFVASGPLGSPNCSVKLTATGVGSNYIFTGPNGYLFSNVFSNSGIHDVYALDVKVPGTYTLNILSGGCQVSSQVQVTGTACP